MKHRSFHFWPQARTADTNTQKRNRVDSTGGAAGGIHWTQNHKQPTNPGAVVRQHHY